ncbi:sensor histidine kinase [Actinomadura parmotrematis]|uniref:Sensor histidine kinase n=1 Tax=Actinomadura parmotrematis TaxID=2864039 RepID=A0ABS7FU51_9ACTN|nr:sensor histidine kinase [Actinomadura parmotrematis]MBW8483841.1 sensor histidine kinase [Actinomadura parmotrematis]
MTTGTRAALALPHRALLHSTPAEFARAAVPYLAEGVGAGEVAVVIAGPDATELIHEGLGAAAHGVEFIAAAGWFTTPVAALASYDERARQDWWPRGRLRLLAEPVWAGRSALEVREWLRHEALLNVALAGSPTTLLCAYDAADLPPALLAHAARTHPELVDEDGIRPSHGYVEPADFYAECNAEPLAPPPITAARRIFGAGELPGLRAFLTREAARHGLPAADTLPFVLAVNEVATMVIRDGGGHGALWVWAADGELVADVTDPNRGMPDRFLGQLPPRPPHQADAAMWAVRRLCHIVEVRSNSMGTRVRLHLRLPA